MWNIINIFGDLFLILKDIQKLEKSHPLPPTPHHLLHLSLKLIQMYCLNVENFASVSILIKLDV